MPRIIQIHYEQKTISGSFALFCDMSCFEKSQFNNQRNSEVIKVNRSLIRGSGGSTSCVFAFVFILLSLQKVGFRVIGALCSEQN